MTIKVIIKNGSNAWEPQIEGSIEYTTSMRGECGKVTFSYINDGVTFPEGSSVDITEDGEGIFYGWIFTKSHSKEPIVKVTAYDQIRYFMNENSYTFENMTVDEIIRKLINDYSGKGKLLQVGKLIYVDCRLNLVEENCKLLDMVEDAIDDTTRTINKSFVFYDNYGKLYLNDVQAMKYKYIVDASNSEDFSYETTIDDNVYNMIFVTYTDDSDNTKYVSASNYKLIQNWGVLSKTEDGGDSKTAQQLADLMLSVYARPYKTLTIKGVFGDFGIRGGASIIVRLPVEDMNISQYMIVDSVTHTFNDTVHTMNLKLIGGAFSR